MVSFSGPFFFYYNIIIENVDINQSNNWAKNHIMDDSRFDNKVIDAESSSSYIVLNLQSILDGFSSILSFPFH